MDNNERAEGSLHFAFCILHLSAMKTELKRILLVDDSARDTELTLNALAEHNLANEIVSLRDGVEALDYLYRRGPFVDRAVGNPAVVMLDLKMPKVDGLGCCGRSRAIRLSK